MAIIRSRKSREQISLNTQSRLKAVRVLDIILDINHPLASEYGNYDSIGTIFYSDLEGNIPNVNPKDAPTASPLFSYLKYYPLINEIVLVLTTNDRNIYDGKQKTTYYLPQVNMWGHPHHNALPTVVGLESEQTTNDYKQTEAGLVRQVEDGGTDINLGNYFQEKLNIKPLLPYEGDMILEGRFGNSIRFGSTNISNDISDPNGWSDSGNTGDPITIIRNGQSSILDEKGWLPTTEDINGDASSIYLTSNQRIRNFRQASPYMNSWDAEYIEPQTIEQELLNPAPGPINNSQNSTLEEVPTFSNNNEGPIISTPTQPVAEADELQEVINNPKSTNESEDIIPDQVVQKDTDIQLPSSYQNPGSGGGEGGGANMDFEITSN